MNMTTDERDIFITTYNRILDHIVSLNASDINLAITLAHQAVSKYRELNRGK